MDVAHPTPYPDVNALLHDVLVGAHQRLGPHFVGMYLEGSLVSDDFDQDSDIDFVVVTSDDLSPEQFTAVQQMHDHIATTPSWYADQLEGFYVAQPALRRYDPAHASLPISSAARASGSNGSSLAVGGGCTSPSCGNAGSPWPAPAHTR